MIIDQALFILVTFLIFIKPVRDKSPIIATAFRSFDRPEDRPFTLLWFTSQGIIRYAATITIAMTLTEAFSLHTLDNPSPAIVGPTLTFLVKNFC